LPVEDIEARAARLGITPERVLEEYARIAFASLGDIVEWDDKGMKLKPDADTAAIIEIVAAAGSGRPYRIKLHDKKPFLDAIARYLGVLPSNKPAKNEDERTDDGEDPREVLARKIARIAAAAGMDTRALVD
jgi:phage terminase small subunit